MNIALICAVPEEFSALKALLDDPVHVPLPLGRSALKGACGGHAVWLLQAGIGKVNAAVLATLVVADIAPDLVLFAGIAGALHDGLKPGDLIVARDACIHDYGAVRARELLRFPSGSLPFGEPPAWPALTVTAADPLIDRILDEMRATGRAARWGRLLTGDQFINCAATRDALRGAFDADAVDMESAVVAGVAHQARIPVVVVRTISDMAGEESTVSYAELAQMAADNAARFVRRLLSGLPADRPPAA